MTRSIFIFERCLKFLSRNENKGKIYCEDKYCFFFQKNKTIKDNKIQHFLAYNKKRLYTFQYEQQLKCTIYITNMLAHNHHIMRICYGITYYQNQSLCFLICSLWPQRQPTPSTETPLSPWSVLSTGLNLSNPGLKSSTGLDPSNPGFKTSTGLDPSDPLAGWSGSGSMSSSLYSAAAIMRCASVLLLPSRCASSWTAVTA